MAKSRSSIKRETTRDKPDDLEGRRTPSARAHEQPTKTPKDIKTQELPDHTPQITVQHFVRGTRDPILLAFAHHEKLAPGMRKRTRAEWEQELEAFRGASR